MSWITFDVTALRDSSGSVPWHIQDGQVILVPRFREMALHGELRIEGAGELRIAETGRVVIKE